MAAQQGRLTDILYNLFPLVVAAAIIFALVVIGGKAVQGHELREEARAAEHRVEDLKKENRGLTQDLEYYRSDEYIEKVAREELGLVRPNDSAVLVVPDGDQRLGSPLPSPIPQPTVEPRRDVPNWQRWVAVFVGDKQ